MSAPTRGSRMIDVCALIRRAMLSMTAVVILLVAGTVPDRADPLSLQAVNSADFSGSAETEDQPSPLLLKAQVLLGRLDMSPGLIDGRWGDNARRATAEFQRVHHLDATG